MSANIMTNNICKIFFPILLLNNALEPLNNALKHTQPWIRDISITNSDLSQKYKEDILKECQILAFFATHWP